MLPQAVYFLSTIFCQLVLLILGSAFIRVFMGIQRADLFAGVAGHLQHPDWGREQIKGACQQHMLQSSAAPEASADRHPHGPTPRLEGPAQSTGRAHDWLRGPHKRAYWWLPYNRAGAQTCMLICKQASLMRSSHMWL